MTRTRDRRILTAIMAAALSLPAACGRESGGSRPGADQAKPDAPSTAPADQPVNPDAKALEGFLQRVNEYVALHQKLEGTLPKLSKEATPVDIDRHQRGLGRLIQDARRGAKPGDIFTAESQAVIKRLLTRVFGGADGAALKASIMDENPGIPKINVNDRYPDTVPVSTIPPQVLQGLPRLPEEMEFRFVGDDLILMDAHAHLIADFIPHALP